MTNQEVRDILFESIKEAKGETFEVDIGEYDKSINSAHELEDIFERRLNEISQSSPEKKCCWKEIGYDEERDHKICCGDYSEKDGKILRCSECSPNTIGEGK